MLTFEVAAALVIEPATSNQALGAFVPMVTFLFSELLSDASHEPFHVAVTNKRPTPKKVETKLVSRPSYRGHRFVRVKLES